MKKLVVVGLLGLLAFGFYKAQTVGTYGKAVKHTYTVENVSKGAVTVLDEHGKALQLYDENLVRGCLSGKIKKGDKITK